MSLNLLPRRFTNLVFYTLIGCFCLGVQPFPVVYPSLTGTTGFAYINDTEELVTIPAALGHLLCSTPGELVDFEPADQPCSEIVFFTSSTFLTFEVLNVSSNGVIQPFTRIPQVTLSNDEVEVNWRIPTRETDEGEEVTRGVSPSVREPTASQTNSPDADPSPSNNTRSENSVSATPSRNAPPSPEPLASSPPPVDETIEAARNETQSSRPPTRSVPVSDSTRNPTAAPEESKTEEASVSPSPPRSAVNRTGTVIPEAKTESTTPPPTESPSQRDAPVEAPAEASMLMATMVLAPASFEAETSPTESPESSKSAPALTPTSAESVIIPESTESLTIPESPTFASIPVPFKFSPQPSLESAPALDTKSGPVEASTASAQFALASVPETSVEDQYVPFLESFSGLEPATDLIVDAEIFAQESKPSMDGSEELEQHRTEASLSSQNTPDQRTTNDTDLEHLIDEAEDGNTPARRSRTESRRRASAGNSSDTSVLGDPDVFISSTADASLESKAEDEEAEEGEERSLRRLMQDLPTAGDSTTVPRTDAAVLQANQTSGFLDPSGALRNDVNFVLQLEAQSLPEQTLVTLDISFGDGITRSLMIYFDSTPVSADIEETPNPNEDANRGRDHYVYRVRFSSRMVSLPTEESMSCPSVAEPLDALSSAQFDATQNSLTPYDLTALIRASERLSSCAGRLEQVDPSALVSVNAADAVSEVEDDEINIDELHQGSRPAGSVVTVNFSTNRDRKKRLTFNVGSNTGFSLSGLSVSQEARQYRVGLGSDRIRDAEDVGENIGTAATALMGTAIGISILANIGLPLLNLFNQGTVDPVGSSSPLSSVVDLLQLGQRTYLMTKLAVPNLPENFIAYGQQLHWTMLDFDLPGEEDSMDDDDTERIEFSSRKLLNNTEEEEDELIGDKRSENGSGRDGEHDGLYKSLRRAYFWTAVSFVGMTMLHLLLLVIFLANDRELPGVLRLPRLEIYLFQATIAVLAGGPANLFAGSTTQVIVGVVVFGICVVPLFYWHVHILRKYVLNEERTERNIAYVLKSVEVAIPAEGNSGRPLPNLDSLRRVPREKIQNEGNTWWFEKYILSVLFGGLYRSGEWKRRDKKAKRVVSRFGPVFEDARGVPMHENPNDESTDEEYSDEENVRDEGPSESTDQARRFEKVEDENRYPIDVPPLSFRLRISEKLINLGKSVFIACLIMGEDHADKDYQAFLILIVLCSYVAYLRVYRPHSIRWKLALAMVSASLEVVLYVLVVVVLYTSKSHDMVFRVDVGTAMLVVTNLSKGLLLLDVVMSCFDMFKEALEVTAGKNQKASTRKKKTRNPAKYPFEEQFWKTPREAINSKIVLPLVESVRSLRSARSARSGRDEPSTEQNPQTES